MVAFAIVTACGNREGADAGSLPFGLEQCTGYAVISADSSAYSEEPVYSDSNNPRSEVRAWAVMQPGFQEIWIDRLHNGWLVVGFDSDIASRRSDLDAAFPGAGVVAVEVQYTQADLDTLTAEVNAVMEANGLEPSAAGSVSEGRVSAFIGELSSASLKPFAQFARRPVCFAGAPAEAGS